MLGCVYREAEGSLPRAMFHLGRAREIYEQTWGATGGSGGAGAAAPRGALPLQGLAGEMEQYDYQLQVLEFHDYLYDPDLLGEHAWPLMHLGRYEEARRFAQAAMQTNDEWQRSLGRNALCAIEGEAKRREPWFRACLDALENARRRVASAASQSSPDGQPQEGPALAVHAYNAALAAASTLRYDEVEIGSRPRRRSASSSRPRTRGASSCAAYSDSGRMMDAVNALREMQRWRFRQPAHLRDQDRAETDVALATVLLVAGEADTGVRAVTRALEQPDRRGPDLDRGPRTRSARTRSCDARSCVRRRSARRAGELVGHVGAHRAHVRGDRAAARIDVRRRAHPSACSRTTTSLVATLRMYVHGGIEPVPTWLSAISSTCWARASSPSRCATRARTSATLPALTPLYDALEAEVALAQGDESKALNMAKAALERLPATEALLRARIAIVAARAAAETGRAREALSFYEEAMQVDGGVIRRMRLSIPARVHAPGGDPIASRAADMIARSPRFDDQPGFEVRVTAHDEVVEACLLSSTGTQIRCAQVDPADLQRQYEEARAAWEDRAHTPAGEPADANEDVGDRPPEPVDPAELLATTFHDTVFSAAIRLSSADLGSLDGRTTTGGEVAREHMRDLLDQAIDSQ